uniref:Uncharacterized protein n=1 Tax=Magallana gigas TaxID=29159 RepID=A0A8W8J7L6_MAGGI
MSCYRGPSTPPLPSSPTPYNAEQQLQLLLSEEMDDIPTESTQTERFAISSEENLRELENARMEAITVKQTTWAVKLFKDWLSQKKKSIHFEELSSNDMAKELRCFYAEAKNGNQYSKSALVSIRAGIVKSLKREGADKTKHHPSISNGYLEKMYSSGVLSITNPTSLRLLTSFEPAYDVWYVNAPMGYHTLGNMMSNISKATGLSLTYTNHCDRATTATVLAHSGVSSLGIMSVTGHRNEKSIQSYVNAPSVSQRRQYSETLERVSTGVVSQCNLSLQPLHHQHPPHLYLKGKFLRVLCLVVVLFSAAQHSMWLGRANYTVHCSWGEKK